MQMYIQVDDQGIIRDAINYEYKGYISVVLPDVLPAGFISGCYKWDTSTNTYTCDETLKQQINDPNNLKLEVEGLKQAIAELSMLFMPQ